MTPANARIVPSTLESDIRELHKWLNEQPNRPVDRPALARVVYYARTASEPDATTQGANQMTTDKPDGGPAFPSNDTELLAAAAKATGIVIEYDEVSGLHWLENKYTALWWNPLHHDGDALRLAVNLGIEYGFGFNSDDSIQRVIIDDDLHVMVENNDPYAATRRAIVRAAAEMERAKS